VSGPACTLWWDETETIERCVPNRLFARTEKRSELMPVKKHLRGVGAKEQRQYEDIKESAEQSGRYGKRAKEVAARTVMKEHREKGHRPGQ
jgi:hypothetical protein